MKDKHANSYIKNDWQFNHRIFGYKVNWDMYKYKCRHCLKEFERDQLIKRSFCEKYQRKTNLIRLI